MVKVRLMALAATVSLLLAGVISTTTQAAPVAGSDWVATPNGMVGVHQTVTVRAAKAAGQVATITFTNDLAGTNAGQAVVDSQGFAYLPWTPNLPGTWTLAARVGNTPVGSSTIVAAAMPTDVVLLAPGEVMANRPTTLVAEVEALAGSIIPSGTVEVRTEAGAVVATGTLIPSARPRTALASIPWTPVPGPVRLTASYTPATRAFTPSTSVPQTPIVGGPQVVSLRLPPVSHVGVAETISAVIQPQFLSPLGGSVAFSLDVDGFVFYPMGGSRPVGSGVGSTTWVPTQAGVQTVGVAYATANFAINGTARQSINVQAAPSPDIITLTPIGAPEWGAGDIRTLRQGDSVEVAPTSQSGNPVTLATDGPCVANAGTLTLLGPGTCSITAASVGNGGSLTATTQTYTISVQAAPRARR